MSTHAKILLLVDKIVAKIKAGETGTPEFEALVKRTGMNGAFMGIATVVIIFRR